MLYVCLQEPKFSIVDRLFDPLRLVQLAVYLVYKGALYLFFRNYWQITTIYNHGGVEYVPQTCLLDICNVRLHLYCVQSHITEASRLTGGALNPGVLLNL